MAQTTPHNKIVLPALVLFVSFELSNSKWLLTLGAGPEKAIRFEINAGDFAAVLEKFEAAKRRFNLPENVLIVSCYEVGRDGFWIHRKLTEMGIRNLVVDPSSIEVNRRARRAKTDRLDGFALLRLLIRYCNGDTSAWKVVFVPSVKDEDARRTHRELERLKQERTGHSNRIISLLKLEGIDVYPDDDFGVKLPRLTRWDGTPLGAAITAEIKREYERLRLVRQQVNELESLRERKFAAVKAAVEATRAKADPIAEVPEKVKGRKGLLAAWEAQKTARRMRLTELERQAQCMPECEYKRIEKVVNLSMLKSVGMTSAWVLVHEVFAWRTFDNGKQVGSVSGLTGTPYNSGASARDQGISKAGIARIRSLMVELAWLWVRYQPDSELTAWFKKFSTTSKRVKKVGIVALARKLLVAFWRFLEKGEIPKGAVLKEDILKPA